jgi:hypothetical protein
LTTLDVRALHNHAEATLGDLRANFEPIVDKTREFDHFKVVLDLDIVFRFFLADFQWSSLH